MTLKVGVVVIGRNEGPRLVDSLRSVLDQAMPLIYADSGSSDDSLAIATELGVPTHSLTPDAPYSAARGRNEGFLQLLAYHPELDAIFFLDGDCTIDAAVIPAGIAALEADPQLALVCNPVREVNRDRDVWKLLCDLEWNQPPGPIDQCGGIFMIRTKAFQAIGGMDTSIVAGEEPEMCLLLKRKGWRLLRIDKGLVLHEIGHFTFFGWWKRCRRSGLAFLLGFLREGFTAERHNFREVLRPWLWCLFLPLAIIFLASALGPEGLLLILLYPLQLVKMVVREYLRGRTLREASAFSAFIMLGHWAEAAGQIGLLWDILSGTAPPARELRDTPLFLHPSSPSTGPLPDSCIGIVVIGRNEGKRLEACLKSLANFSSHLVYVDSGSTDHSTEFARSIGVRVVDLDMSTPFTAARARNAGFDLLREIDPMLEFVQFVDGDCEVDPDWIQSATRALQRRPGVVAVAGRRREQHPEASIYNRLADLEWDTPIGPVKWCGGDVLMRAAAFADVGGYDPQLIACEEPELCFRLRALGWTILRIDGEMTLHDANITRFGQWWKRNTRTGYAYLQAAALHREESGPFLHREIRSAIIWGVGFPLISVAPLFEPWLFPVLLIFTFLQALRIMRHPRGSSSAVSLRFAFISIFVNIPIAAGMSRYMGFRLLGHQSKLIEYK
jgi:GT2 family glycosyltransferase